MKSYSQVDDMIVDTADIASYSGKIYTKALRVYKIHVQRALHIAYRNSTTGFTTSQQHPIWPTCLSSFDLASQGINMTESTETRCTSETV